MPSSFVSFLYFGLVLALAQRPTEIRDIAMLKKAPAIVGDSYRCADMAVVLNHLRKIGKDKCLATLRGHLSNSGEHDKVIVICRLLFVNPKGWNPPVLGAPLPAINQNLAKQFPLFPIAVSDRVPFLLLKGYQLKGQGESATECLKLCEGLSLIKEDYPLSGYEKAARALTRTQSFLNLYQEKDRREMVEMILRQATVAKTAEKQ